MQCAQCHHPNSSAAKFCEACGSKLVQLCPSCSHPAGPQAKFCSECGATLTPALEGAVATAEAAPSGERRQLTVLFCDLVGSTELAARLDPEDWRDIAAQYQRSAAEAVTDFGGHVAKYLGDGLLAYFGWPHAHDDDAERSVRAGLRILDVVRELGVRLQSETQRDVPLRVRVGVHTGPVVIGQGGGAQDDIFGDTPNIAARVQGVAEPDTVLITAATYALVPGLFVVDDRGAASLRGAADPVHLYRAMRPSGVRGRVHATAARGLTPFVGREHERRLLLDRWERVCDGEGQVALILGEAGIGKSRLLQQFRHDLGDVEHTWTEYGGSPFFQQTPLHVVAELLQQAFGWPTDVPLPTRIMSLERALTTAGVDPATAVPLVAPLFNLPVPEGYAALPQEPEQRRRRLLSTLVAWTLGAARVRPTVVATEDVQWADPSTLALHSMLVEQGATVPLLLIYTARPEFSPPWPQRSHHLHVTLNRLSRHQVQSMVERVAGRTLLPRAIMHTVVTRTDGVPLFVEELTKAVVETAGAAVHEIPTTLQDSLMARLDRLGSAKDIAQVASVLGREFSYALLRAVSSLGEAEFDDALQRLANADLVYVRGFPPQATYQFKHALVQEAAYSSLLRSRRRELHRLVAEVLVQQFPTTAEAQPEVVAQHYSQAALPGDAVPYWQRAGRGALERSANQEAIGHLTRGLELLEQLADAPERAQLELGLLLPLATAWMAAGGYAAPEVEKAYSRAQALCQRVESSPRLLHVSLGLWSFHFVRANHDTARQLAEQTLRLAEQHGHRFLQSVAHQQLGTSLRYQGEPERACQHFDRSLQLREGDTRDLLAIGAVQSSTFAHRALALWTLGYPDRALSNVRDACAIAARLSRPLDKAQALGVAAHCLVYRQDWELVYERCQEMIQLCVDQSLPLWWASAVLLQAGALTERGQVDEAIAQIQRGLPEWERTGARLGMGVYMCLLARAYAKAGRTDEGLQAVAHAQELAPVTGEHGDDAELHRLKGVLTLQRADTALESVAEECFRSAVEVAQRQKAKSWELRAATDLARLWQRQGKSRDAREMLASIYDWFTEGFGTRDLQDARNLLAKLL